MPHTLHSQELQFQPALMALSLRVVMWCYVQWSGLLHCSDACVVLAVPVFSLLANAYNTLIARYPSNVSHVCLDDVRSPFPSFPSMCLALLEFTVEWQLLTARHTKTRSAYYCVKMFLLCSSLSGIIPLNRCKLSLHQPQFPLAQLHR